MPNLLQALRRRSPQPATRHVTNVDDYLQTVNQLEFLYNGYDFTPSWMQSGLTGTYGTPSVEGIANNLESYARGAYEANGIIFAIMSVRMLAFSAIRFQWQRLNKGRPSEMFGSASLGMLEQPWIGGTTQDLLSRVIQDADLAGNSYWVDVAQVARADALEGVRVPGPQAELVRLRPDWVHIVLEPRIIRGAQVGHRRVGYMYWEGGPHSGAAPAAFLPDEVVHFMPNPDNLADWRGMSWLTPVLREIEDDKSMNRYKSSFLRNNATPNLSVSLDKDVSLAAFQAFKDAMDAGHKGPENAGKTLYLGGGADVKVIGADFHQMDFRQIQGHAETRIAAAGGVPPIIVGLSEGLQSATYSNYSQARRRFADGTMHPLWQNVAGSFANIVPKPVSPVAPQDFDNVRLWYESRDVPFLREDRQDAAQIQSTQSGAINALIMAGFEPDTAVKAVMAEDWDLLKHTGLVSVQLLPPGTQTTGQGASSSPAPAAKPDQKPDPKPAPKTNKPEVTGA